MNPEPNIAAYITPALCVGARVSGWLSFTPFLGHAALPAPVKAILTIALTVLLFPVVGANVEANVGTSAATAASAAAIYPGPLVLAGELAVGMIMGLCLQLVFEGIQMGGQVVGTQLGFSMANMIDPMSQVETTVISVFHQTIALLMFLQMNVHLRLIQALARSFRYLPAGSAFTMHVPAQQLLHAAAGMFLVALEIAAPVMLATMLTDVTLAFISRSSPQLPVMLMGFSVKGLLGFAVMGSTVAFWPWMFEKHFLAALGMAEKMLLP
jgi:flagellar biosynthesis protein FliR